MPTKWYGKAAQNIAAKKIDLINDDIRVALFTSSYVPNQDNHERLADITGEVAGAGYTAGGRSLVNKRLTQNSSTNVWTYDADDLTFPAVTLTFRYGVIYDNTHADKPLIAYVDFTTNQTAAAQDLTLRWEYSGFDPDTAEPTTVHGILEIGY